MSISQTLIADWVCSPGETILDVLEDRRINSEEFARLLQKPVQFAIDLIEARISVTEDLARDLQTVLGSTAEFWLRREAQFREASTWINQDWSAHSWVQWLRELPLKDMLKLGWIDPATRSSKDLALACLRFFSVADLQAWTARYSAANATAFRTSKSYESLQGSVAAWLRQGEIEGEAIECDAWDSDRLLTCLPEIRTLTRCKSPEAFLPKLKTLCAACGVAVAVVRAPNGSRASGATKFLAPEKALVLLSFRYLSDDHFWFTFFHEIGHLILHNHRFLFLEGSDIEPSNEEEEANEFAAHALIPEEFEDEMLRLPLDGHAVIRFAVKVGVSPGIVAGQLQHHGRIKHHQLNSLKRRFSWGEQ